jgi:hypothetical protein
MALMPSRKDGHPLLHREAPVRIGDRVLAFFGDPGDNSRVDANYVLGRHFVRNSAMTTVTGNSHAAIFRRLIESDQEDLPAAGRIGAVQPGR